MYIHATFLLFSCPVGLATFPKVKRSRIITSPVSVLFSSTSLLKNNPDNSPIRSCRQISHPSSREPTHQQEDHVQSGSQWSGDRPVSSQLGFRLARFCKLLVPFAKISSDVLEVSHPFNLFLKLDINLNVQSFLQFICLITRLTNIPFFFFW